VSTPDIILRNLIYEAILEKKRTDQYVVNDFEAEQTYYPWQKLEDIPEHGKVWVLSLASDDRLLTRNNSFVRDIPVQIGLQHLLRGASPGELTSEIDRYRELEEQLRDTLRMATVGNNHFDWTRTEALKDENSMPFSFLGMRQQNTFEAYFTSYYKVILE
jgi:hypothetical protein